MALPLLGNLGASSQKGHSLNVLRPILRSSAVQKFIHFLVACENLESKSLIGGNKFCFRWEILQVTP